jgi:hypothetical protein
MGRTSPSANRNTLFFIDYYNQNLLSGKVPSPWSPMKRAAQPTVFFPFYELFIHRLSGMDFEYRIKEGTTEAILVLNISV